MNIFKRFRYSLRLKEAIRRADEKHKETGERYYVMPLDNGKLLVLDRANFKTYKKKGYINRSYTVLDMYRRCFYATPYKNGDEKMSEFMRRLKAGEYLTWVESQK